MKKTVISIKKFFTQQELGFTCIKPIRGELFGRYRCRDIWVSNFGRVVSTDFQGSGQERELIPIDDGHGLTITVRRKHFNPNGVHLNKMVAEVFLENPGNCKSVRYLDGDYHNCRADNLYYYYGHKEKAGKEYPDTDIFDCERLIPLKNRDIDVFPSGIVATTRKRVWDRGERLRRMETMKNKEAERTDSGYTTTVVDGGGVISKFEMIDGRFVLKTSWGTCITVRRVNQPIVEVSDLTLILDSIKETCAELMVDDNQMELADVHIENLAFSKDAWECSETTFSLAA